MPESDETDVDGEEMQKSLPVPPAVHHKYDPAHHVDFASSSDPPVIVVLLKRVHYRVRLKTQLVVLFCIVVTLALGSLSSYGDNEVGVEVSLPSYEMQLSHVTDYTGSSSKNNFPMDSIASNDVVDRGDETPYMLSNSLVAPLNQQRKMQQAFHRFVTFPLPTDWLKVSQQKTTLNNLQSNINFSLLLESNGKKLKNIKKLIRIRRSDSEQKESNAKLFNVIRKKTLSEHEKLEKIKEYFERNPKPNVNAQDGNDEMNTPLHMAVRRGYLTIVNFLLKQGGDKTLPNNDGNTPLTLSNLLDERNIFIALESTISDASHLDNIVIRQLPQHVKQSKPLFPDTFFQGQAIGLGDCFFDTLAQGMNRLNLGKKFDIKSLRQACFDFASDNANNVYEPKKTWRQVIEEDATGGGYAGDNTGSTSEVGYFNIYLKDIRITAEQTKNNLKLPRTIWGRPEIEGRMLCHKFGIKIHLIEIQTADNKEIIAHQLIDTFGSSSIDEEDSLYGDTKVVHILNKGKAHFDPILQKPVVSNKRLEKQTLLSPTKEIKENAINEDDVENRHLALKRKLDFTGNGASISKPKKISNLPDEANPYEASGVKLTLHGVAYQWKILMLMAVRCQQNSYAFRLATEMNNAEKFDDVVLWYIKPEDNVQHSIFLQAKHVDVKSAEQKKITAQDLLTETDDRFSLQKYFLSYQKIKERQLGENVKFFIYTNINFDFDDVEKASLRLAPLQEGYDLLNFENDKQIKDQYRIKFASELEREVGMAKLKGLFKRTSDFQKLADSLAHHLVNGESIKLEGLFKKYHEALARYVIDIKSNTLKMETLDDSPTELGSFREALRKSIEHLEALEKTPNKKGIKRHNDQTKTLCPEPPCKKPTMNNQDEDNYSREMRNKKFKISVGFKKIFVPVPKLELNNPTKLAKEIARLIIEKDKTKGNIYKKITISQGSKKGNNVINSELSTLAGHVLVKRKGGKEIIFSTSFLEGNSDLKNALLSELRIKSTQDFKNRLACYTFSIANFETCEESEFKNLIRAQSRFPKQEVTVEEIDEFLEHLVFAVNQPNEIRLSKLISKTLGVQFNLIDGDLITSDFQNEILEWVKDRQGTFYSENRIGAFLKEMGEKISQLVLTGSTIEYTQKIKEYGLAFNDKHFYDKLTDFLKNNKKSILNVIVEINLTLLGSIKVNQVMTGKRRDSYISNRLSSLIRLQDEMLQAFRKNHNNLLIIENKSKPTEDVKDLCNELHKIVEKEREKKVIFISTKDDPLAIYFRDYFAPDYQEIVERLEFKQLTAVSKKKILARRVSFQGTEVALNQLITSESPITELLPLADLLKEERSEIGKPIPISSGYDETCYVDRVLISKKNGNDIDECADILKTNQQEFINQIHTQPVIIIADTAGMGKSTLLTNLCMKMKHQYPNYWIEKIDLSHYTDTMKLKQRENRKFTPESAIDFLIDGMTEIEKKGIEKPLFQHMLRDKKVIVMLDGFDEISPNYKTFVLDLIINIKQTSIKQLWVTTRPHLTNVLEGALKPFSEGPFSYGLEPFSRENQLAYMTKFFGKSFQNTEVHTKKIENYANALIDKLEISIKDTKFTGIPLQTSMLAEAFYEKFKEYYQSGSLENNLPNKLNLLDLYEYFLDRKYLIYISEKNTPSVINVATEELIDILKGGVNLRKTYQQLAIKMLFSQGEVEIFLENKKARDIQNEKLSRVGIAQKNGNIYFVHQTFAEYFVADFLIEQLKTEKQTSHEFQDILLKKIFLLSDYQVIRSFLELFLQKTQIAERTLAQYGNRIKFLWDNHFLKELTAYSKSTILHIAAQEDNVNVIGFFSDSLMTGKCTDTYYDLFIAEELRQQTAWHVSAREGNIEALEKLWTWGKDIKLNLVLYTASDGYTAWIQAALWGRKHILEKLWLWGKEEKLTQEETKNKLLLSRLSNRQTAWHLAARFGYTRELENLWAWAQEIGVNVRDDLLLSTANKERTAFHLASEKGFVEVLEKLWVWAKENELNVKESLLMAKDIDERTALNLAVYEGQINVLERIWKWSVEEKLTQDEIKNNFLLNKDKEGQTVWHDAARKGDIKIFKKLWTFAQETKLNIKDEVLLSKNNRKETLWYLAAYTEHVDDFIFPVLELITKELKIDGKEILTMLLEEDKYKETALNLMVRYGNVNILKKLQVLFKSSALQKELLSIKNENGRTIWYDVAENGCIDMLESLIGWGTEENLKLFDLLFKQKDIEGKNVLHIAAENGNLEIIEKLFELDKKDEMSVENFKQLLLEEDSSGETLWEKAVENSNSKRSLEILWRLADEAELNIEEYKNLLFFENSFKSDMLHKIVEDGHVKLVDKEYELYKAHLSSDEFKDLLFKKDIAGRNILQSAIANGNIHMVEKVIHLTEKVKFNKQNLKKLLLTKTDSMQTVLHLAVDQTQKAIIKIQLLKIIESLIIKSQMHLPEFKELLLARNSFGRNVLRVAVAAGHTKVIEKICELSLKAQLSKDEFKNNLLLSKDVMEINALEILRSNQRIHEKTKSEIINLLEQYPLKSGTEVDSLVPLKEILERSKDIELEPVAGSSTDCTPRRRRRRDLNSCVTENKQEDRVFPYEPLEESVSEVQRQSARLYSQLAIIDAWQQGKSPDALLRYQRHLGDILEERLINMSPREQKIVRDHYQQAHRFFQDNPKTTLLEAQVDDFEPLTGQSVLLEDGQHSLIILNEGPRYQLYSQDFNYRQRFHTKSGVSWGKVTTFIQSFFLWKTGSRDYYILTLQPLSEKTLKSLREAPLWQPENVTPDSVLLAREQFRRIEGIPVRIVRELFRVNGHVVEVNALHADFFRRTAEIQLRVEYLHTVLAEITPEQQQQLVQILKKYQFAPDCILLKNLDTDMQFLFADYQQRVTTELKTTETITPERLSQFSWQALNQAFDKYPDISLELKQQALASVQELQATTAKHAWAKGMVTQTLFFLPDMIRSANTGELGGFLRMGGMLAVDSTVNNLYENLLGRLTPTLGEARLSLLRKLPITSPVFKTLTVYSIVELTQQLQSLPPDSEQRHIIKHRLGEQYVTAGLMVAELFGWETGPLWVGLIAEQLIFEAITFRKEKELDIPFWEAFMMSLGFEQDKLQHILEERQLLEINLATLNNINTHAQPPYGFGLVKLPLLGPLTWTTLNEQQVPDSVRKEISHLRAPFSFNILTEVLESKGFRQVKKFKGKLHAAYTAAVVTRGALLTTHWEHGVYRAGSTSSVVQFAPIGKGCQEDNVFLANPKGTVSNYHRVASVIGENYQFCVPSIPVHISGPGLAALYANNNTASDVRASRNLYVHFDPREGDTTLVFNNIGLETLENMNQIFNPQFHSNSSFRYQVTVQVSYKPYPDSIIFPRDSGLFLLRDATKRVNSQYFISPDSHPFRIHDEATVTRMAFAASKANGYIIESDGPEIIRLYSLNATATQSNDSTLMPAFSTVWLKGPRKYLQLQLAFQKISGVLRLAAEQVEILSAKGQDAYQSSILMTPSVTNFTVTLMGHLQITQGNTRLFFIGETLDSKLIRYTKLRSVPNSPIYQLEITALHAVLDSLSRSNPRQIHFSTPGLNYTWVPGAERNSILKIIGTLKNGQQAQLVLKHKMSIFRKLGGWKSHTIQVDHYTPHATLDSLLILHKVVSGGGKTSMAYLDGSCNSLLFLSVQGYLVIHRFPAGQTLTLNGIYYQVIGQQLYAIGALNGIINGKVLIRYHISTRRVRILLNSSLSESTLSLEQDTLTINQLTLRHLPHQTLIIFNEGTFPLEALKESAHRNRHPRSLPNAESLSSGAAKNKPWTNALIIMQVVNLLSGLH